MAKTRRRPTPPLAQWLLAGQRVLYGRHRQGLRLQKQAEAASLPLENPVYREALQETKAFFTWYDIRFLAHQIPCMIDYPLNCPVDERLKGVDYINEWLRRRLWEDELCGRFAPGTVQAVLARQSADYATLPLNMFGSVFQRALGGALLHEEPGLAPLPAGRQAALWALVQAQTPAGMAQKLAEATARLCSALRIWPTAQRSYYRACAQALAPHLLAAGEDGVRQVFL